MRPWSMPDWRDVRDWLLFALPVIALASSWLVGRFTRGRTQWALLVAILLAPVLVHTAAMLLLKAAAGGFWLWWIAGLAMVGIPLLLWLMLAGIGFDLGRRASRAASGSGYH